MGVGIAAIIMGLTGLVVASRGVFASRARLQEMSAVIGTKNPTVGRIVCCVALLPSLALIVVGAVMCVGGVACLFESEVTSVENVVRNGLKEKTGKVPDSVSLTGDGNGNYKGTASFGSETFDVTASGKGSTLEWNAESRKAKADAKELESLRSRVTDEILAKHPGSTILNLNLGKCGDEGYRGSVTTTGIVDELEPEKKLPAGQAGFTRSFVTTWDLEVDKSGTKWELLSRYRKK